MLKIETPEINNFDIFNDSGYALDESRNLWYFDEEGNCIRFDSNCIEIFSTVTIAERYGPFTRFTGTATIGND